MDFFLGLILFFALLWYGFKIFLRYGLPWLLARFFRNQQAKYNQTNQSQDPFQRKDGEVEVKTKKTKKPKNDEGFGEYVDYEDINE